MAELQAPLSALASAQLVHEVNGGEARRGCNEQSECGPVKTMLFLCNTRGRMRAWY